jgi:2-furoyl-CoA dehydrogenase FAD binding subunit
VKPVAFEYCRPDTLEEAMELLAEFGSDASIVSGGLSLGAMLNMRLVRPRALIDVNRIDALGDIKVAASGTSTGAMVRQAVALKSPEIAEAVPLLARALPNVGHYQTRSRGTLGGSVAHADPSAEIPLSLVTLGGAVRLRSPKGAREVVAREFFHGVLTTDRRADEMVTGLVWPARALRTGYAFEEIAQRHGDFAIVAAAAAVTVGDDGNITALSFGLGGVEDRPFVVDNPDFIGRPAITATAQEIADAAAEIVEPMVDIQASADYRRQLVRVIGAKALMAAIADAEAQREAA